MKRLLNHKGTPRAGMGLVEAVISVCVLVIGLLALSSTSVVIHSLSDADEARGLATQAMQNAIESAKNTSERASSNPQGWSATLTRSLGPEGTPGHQFEVPGLTPWEQESQVGSMILLTDETITDAALGITLGMPRDLNGDGDAADTDVSGDAILLPVLVRCRWSGSGGDREALQATYLNRK
ncbi:MAG: hypothetical protein KDB61_00095 [Planctomycetes bacterium]|nr:hypothetical protein [Planctomycetota bacterium]